MPRTTKKAQATEHRILNTALVLFRKKGFDATTTREIAKKAGVAPSAAYYYYPSKDAMVMAYYEQTFERMRAKVEEIIQAPGGVEERMRALIRLKFSYFEREILRALVRNGADPKHPISPFSKESRAFREMEIGWFRRILADGGVHAPGELADRIPEVLWALHIGILFFWVTDESPRQSDTMRLLDQGMKTVTALLRVPPLSPALLEAS